MPLLTHSKIMTKSNLSLLLSTAISMLVLSLPVAQAQIGPQAPPPKPPAENHVGKALSKWLKGTKKPDATTSQANKPNRSLTKDDNLIMNPDQQQAAPAKPQPGQMPTAPTTSIQHPPLLVQPPLSNAKIDKTVLDSENPPALNHPKLDDPTNPLGFADAEVKLKKLSLLVDEKRFMEAKPGLIQLRQSLVDLTEAHIGLYKTLNQVPSAKGQAELEKELALEFAQLRDRAMMETAKVYIAEREYTKAVKELSDVVKSQPRSKLGLRSYEILQEIGFTEKLQLTQ